jgi:hypothetical protein
MGWVLAEYVTTSSGGEKIKFYTVPMFDTQDEAQAHLEKVRNEPPFAGHDVRVMHWTPEPKRKASPRSSRRQGRR